VGEPVNSRQLALWDQLRQGHEDEDGADACPSDLSFLCCLFGWVADLRIGDTLNPDVVSVIEFLARRDSIADTRRLLKSVCNCVAVACPDGSTQLPVDIRRYSRLDLLSEHMAFGVLADLCCSDAAYDVLFDAIRDNRVDTLRAMQKYCCAAPPVVQPPPAPPVQQPPVNQPPPVNVPTPVVNVPVDCPLPPQALLGGGTAVT